MRSPALVVLLALGASCSGSSDAPRPLAPSSVDDRGGSGIEIPRDDDGDGVENEQDSCPLAADHSEDPRRDGCPDAPAPDAGVLP